MNIYKKIAAYFPKSIKQDIKTNYNYLDNALSFYGSAWDRNRQKSAVDGIFRESHRFIKALSLAANFFDRRLARLQVAWLRQRGQRDPLLKKNDILKNKHKNQRCFILGQGPSLAKQDLSPLAKEITITTNTFWKHPILSKDWQITYYCTGHFDRFYMSEFEKDENFKADTLDYYKKVREKMFAATYLLPLYSREANEKYKLFPEEKTFYIPFLQYPLLEFLPSYPDLLAGVPSASDSSQLAIMMAMHMGCNPIILLGCDHDVCFEFTEPYKHFFEGPAFGSESADDILANSHVYIMDNIYFAWCIWRGHYNLRQMAEAHGVEILNATGGGVLDIYKYANYEKLMGQKNDAQ